MISPNPSTLPTPFNLRADLLARIADSGGKITFDFQKYLTNLGRVLESMYMVNVANLGANGNDTFDDTAAFQLAVNNVVAAGGGSIYIPGGGTYSVSSVQTPVGNTPIRFFGDGATSLVKRRGTLAPGVGIFNVLGSNVSFEGFTIDGDTTVPVGLEYGSGFSTALNVNDPMAPSLTTNTSIWIHGPSSDFYFNRMKFQHSAGYAILFDALPGDISDINIVNCTFENNRPTLFGTNPADLTYGSWNGGVFFKGDGNAGVGGVISNVNVEGCSWSRNTGNCLWMHCYALDRLHTGFRFVDNNFLDCGLDGILMGALTVGVVEGNTFRRVGYVTMNDTDRSIPKWLTNVNATALDSSGIVKGVNYQGNSFLSINGGCIDADGHCMSSVSDNTCRIPYPDEPEYEEDQIAITGPTNSGSGSYSINFNNTNNSPYGAQFVTMTGNQLINMAGGAVRLFGARNCLFEANSIVSPPAPFIAPISMGPVGVGPYQRCYGNKICHNHINFDPTTPGDPAIQESDIIVAFTGGETNAVFGNCPLFPDGTSAIEFKKSATSGSVVYLETVWFT